MTQIGLRHLKFKVIYFDPKRVKWEFITKTDFKNYRNCYPGIKFGLNHPKKMNLSLFLRRVAPAQRAAGGCSPLKVTPGREPAAGDFF